jgi:transposase
MAVAGIDWASETHVCCVIDDAGGVVERFDVAHDASSLRVMVKRLVRLGVSGVAIERGDGPVVEVLMDAQMPVFVVPSRQVKGLRSQYGSAGNKDDRFDAYVRADTLRTDGHRWRQLQEDRSDTKALRALCRARRELVASASLRSTSCAATSSSRCPGRLACSASPTARSP